MEERAGERRPVFCDRGMMHNQERQQVLEVRPATLAPCLYGSDERRDGFEGVPGSRHSVEQGSVGVVECWSSGVMGRWVGEPEVLLKIEN